MRSRVVGALLCALLVLPVAGCSDETPPPVAVPTPTAAPTMPTYDGALEPAAAVLALVPEAAVTLTVTDYDQVREELGLTSLTTASPVEEQAAFWTRAEATSPLLSPGLLRPAEGVLRTDYGISQTDIAWEAHFFDAAGAELGWVLALRPETSLDAVRGAVIAGAGPLAGSDLRPGLRIVTRGVTDDGFASWADDEQTRELVGLPALATYVERGCVPRDVVPSALLDLDGYSVQFEGTLVTARLGPNRLDLFDRLRLSTAFAPFAQAYEGGVADPRTGRIGFAMTDPPAAADLALRRGLPFSACAT